jgi:hypothetical protein
VICPFLTARATAVWAACAILPSGVACSFNRAFFWFRRPAEETVYLRILARYAGDCLRARVYRWPRVVVVRHFTETAFVQDLQFARNPSLPSGCL